MIPRCGRCCGTGAVRAPSGSHFWGGSQSPGHQHPTARMAAFALLNARGLTARRGLSRGAEGLAGLVVQSKLVVPIQVLLPILLLLLH